MKDKSADNQRKVNNSEQFDAIENASEINENDYNKIDIKAMNRYGSATENSDNVKMPHGPKERFFNFCDKFGDLFLLNILFILTSIPVITIGASFTALYSVIFKMVENKEGTVGKQYFKAFKNNFKPATKIWVIHMILLALMYYGYTSTIGVDTMISKIVIPLIGFGMVLLSFEVPIVFPLIARYENTTWNYIKNSFIISFTNLGMWFRTFFFWVFPWIIYYLRPSIFLYTWYFWLMIFVSAIAYLCSISFIKLFKKLEQKKGTDDMEENDENFAAAEEANMAGNKEKTEEIEKTEDIEKTKEKEITEE